MQPSTALLSNPASYLELDRDARLRQVMEMRVSRQNEDDNSDEEDHDTRFLQTMKTPGKHMDRKFFKNIESDYLM